MSKIIESFIKQEYLGRRVPDFQVGDIVRVHQVVPDIKKSEVKVLSKTAKAIKKTAVTEEAGAGVRNQIFEGTVIARKHGREPGASFTVRRIASGGVGVEKIFPLYSPLVTKVEIVSRPTKRVRRAKLYFLRGRVGKKARRLGVGEAVGGQNQEVGIMNQGETEAEIEKETQEEKLPDS